MKVVERGDDDLIDLQRNIDWRHVLNNNPVEFQRPATKLHSGRPCIQFIAVLLASVLVMIAIIMIINNVQEAFICMFLAILSLCV